MAYRVLGSQEAASSTSGPKLHRIRHINTMRTVTSLQACPSMTAFAAGDDTNGAWVYSFSPRSGFQVA